MARPPLQFRTPATTWMITAAFFSLILHGVCWFIVQLLTGNEQPLGEAQRQMTIGLAWMVGALAIWRVYMPPSRLHAMMTLVICALFVTLFGSVVALVISLHRGAPMTQELLSTFSVYGGLMILGQLALALPSGLLLQGVALTRPHDGTKAE